MHAVQADISSVETLVESILDGVSIHLSGVPGVGKTWLSSQVAERLSADGWAVERVVGSPGLSEVAFGATSHLLPFAPMPAPELLVAAVARGIDGLAVEAPLLLIVDDVDLLDPSSAAVVHQLVAAGQHRVLATSREEGRSFFARAAVEIVDVGPLSRAGNDRFVEAHLAGPASSRLLSTVWNLSLGNPFASGEVLRSATTSRSLSKHGDVWDLDGSAEPLGVIAAVDERLDWYVDEPRQVIDCVAIAEPLRVAVVERLGLSSHLEALEADGVLTSRSVANGLVVEMAHPLLGEALRQHITPLRRTRLLQELVPALAHSIGPGDASGLVRTARWAVETDVQLGPHVTEAAAFSAMATFDLQSALLILDHAPRQERTMRTLLIEGQARALSGDRDAAEAAFSEAVERADGEAERASAVAAYGEITAFVFGDPMGARTMIEAALAETADLAARAELVSKLAVPAALLGDFGPSLEAADQLLYAPDLEPLTELQLLVANTLAETMVGPRPNVEDRLTRGLALARELGPLHPLALDQLACNRVFLDIARADLLTAADHVEAGLDAASMAGRSTAIWHLMGTMVDGMQGDLVQHEERVARAKAEVEAIDPLGLQPLALVVEAHGAALAGDLDRLQYLLDENVAIMKLDSVRAVSWFGRAEAGLLHLQGHTADAANRTLDAARASLAADHVIWGATAAHDAVRYGFADDAVAVLEILETKGDGSDIVQLLADHARAAVRADPHELTTIGDRFLAAGSRALAVGAFAQASAVAPEPDATRLALQAHRAAAGTRELALWELDACPHPLSSREQEICEAAAAGRSSRAIAEDLFLSARTVDNHLGRIYTKLGINGREELTALLTEPVL